jgi:pimeloyl-ACP methyl ester carboxylesterase
VKTIWNELLGTQTRYRGKKFATRTIETGFDNPSKLVLMHGVGGHAEAYTRNMQRLGTAHHAIAIDLLWHGLSSKPTFTPDMIPMYTEQYIDLLDDLGVEKASIEGESLGGWVALWTALHHPERVEKIILNTTAGIRWNRDKVKIDEATGTNLLRERSLAAIANPTRETIKARLEWLMASPDRVTDELIDLRYALYTRPDTNASLTNVFANSFQRGPDAKFFVEEDQLSSLTVPAFALWSDKNPGAGADVGERLAALIPGSSHYCIRDAGHWPQWEQAEDHDRVVLDFLAGRRVDDAALAAPAS